MTSHEDPSRRRFLGAAVATMVGRADRSHSNARAVVRRNTPVGAAEDTAGASAGLGTPNQIAAGVLDHDGPPVVLQHLEVASSREGARRIEPRRSSGGDQRRGQCHQEQHRRHRHEGQRVGRLDVHELRRHHTAGTHGS
jgi:hypothetical protein